MAEQEREGESPATPEDAAVEPGPAAEAATQPPARAERAAPARPEARPPRPGAGASPHGPATAVVLPERVPGQPIVSRRRVLQAGFWASIGAMLAGAGACGLDLILPSKVTGFGGKVAVSKTQIPAPGQKVQIPEGRFWLVSLTEEQGGPGLLALWWRCPHLGCTVPWRPTFIWPDPATGALKQGWYRCPCHGSTYTDAGVRVYGPAPRSMDTMSISVTGSGDLIVDTGKRTNGGPDNPDRAVRI